MGIVLALHDKKIPPEVRLEPRVAEETLEWDDGLSGEAADPDDLGETLDGDLGSFLAGHHNFVED